MIRAIDHIPIKATLVLSFTDQITYKINFGLFNEFCKKLACDDKENLTSEIEINLKLYHNFYIDCIYKYTQVYRLYLKTYSDYI